MTSPARVSDDPPASFGADRRVRRARDASVLLIIAVTSLAALRPPLDDYLFSYGWMPEFVEVLPLTAIAAIRICAFWIVAAAIVGAILLRVEPKLGLLDATIGGLAGVWIFAYVGGNVLGPIGLFRSWTIWALLAVGGFWLWRAGPPKIVPRPPSIGLKLTLLTFILAAPTLLLVQLGSIVPPYMDVLATPASAQRIVTFGRYLPFDNDPYGYWDAASQCPGVELLYALLSMGSGTSPTVMAVTGTIVPMAAFLILSTYRLGRTIGGDVAGGMAAMLLFAGVFFRTLPYMHGRFATYALAGAGLGLFLDPRRNRTRLMLGTLALATAVAAHAIVGAFAMATAAGVVLLWLLSGALVSAVAGFGLLAGATLIALPTVAVGLRIALPYPVLPVAQLLGVLLAYISAQKLHERPVKDPFPMRGLRWGVTLVVAVALANSLFLEMGSRWLLDRYPLALGTTQGHPARFPLLYLGAGLGLVGMICLDRRPSRVLLAPVVVALLLGLGVDYTSTRTWKSFSDPRMQTAVEDFYHKVDYWYPYILALPTACLGAWLYHRISRRWVVFALLALLFFPWKDSSRADPNYHQHAIAEHWAHHMALAKGGYWGSTGHRRWAQTPAELALADVLLGEVAAGRITPATHVMHIEPFLLLYQDTIHFSVYTGINDDTYIEGLKEIDRSIAGGRVRRADQVPAALARRPPYVVFHDVTTHNTKLDTVLREAPAEVLQEYDEIFNRDGVRLLRHRSLRG